MAGSNEVSLNESMVICFFLFFFTLSFTFCTILVIKDGFFVVLVFEVENQLDLKRNLDVFWWGSEV
jgi:hypothetical protein